MRLLADHQRLLPSVPASGVHSSPLSQPFRTATLLVLLLLLFSPEWSRPYRHEPTTPTINAANFLDISQSPR
jgi:hypothetical protein